MLGICVIPVVALYCSTHVYCSVEHGVVYCATHSTAIATLTASKYTQTTKNKTFWQQSGQQVMNVTCPIKPT